MSCYRWKGVLGRINRRTADRRTLVLAEDEPLCHRPLPLPLVVAGETAVLQVGWIRGVQRGVTALRAWGTINLAAGTPLADVLLSGQTLPVAVRVLGGHVRLGNLKWWHPLLRPLGYDVPRHATLTGWTITGAIITGHTHSPERTEIALWI